MCNVVDNSLYKWGLSPSFSISIGARSVERWLARARRQFAEPPASGENVISSECLSQLIRGWILNGGLQKGYHGFESTVRDILSTCQCQCRGSHVCNLKNSPSFPKSLLAILASGLSLTVEGMADALHHSEIFDEWWSKDSIDRAFGAKVDFFAQIGTGRNVFVNPPLDKSGEERAFIPKSLLR